MVTFPGSWKFNCPVGLVLAPVRRKSSTPTPTANTNVNSDSAQLNALDQFKSRSRLVDIQEPSELLSPSVYFRVRVRLAR